MPPSQPTPTILGVQDVRLRFGLQVVLDGVTLGIHEGDRIGLIGANGTGKSSLMRMLSGDLVPDSGEVTRRSGLRVARLAQSDGLPGDATVHQVLAAGQAEVSALVAAYQAHTQALGDDGTGTEYARRRAEAKAAEAEAAQAALDTHGLWDYERELKRLSVALALPPGERPVATLSGGERRRLDLAVKLLAEPTNHIDTTSVEWVERFLERYEGSCVLITHDRYFLDRVVNRIVELEHGQLLSFPGSYADFLAYKSDLESQRARAESNRQALLRRELAWLRRGAKARSTKQKARIGRYEATDAQGPPPREREFDFIIPTPERLGKTVLEARDVGYGYDEGYLFRDVALLMQAGMRVGLAGPNGAGKTTLLRVLMGELRPKKGRVVIGENTRFLYVDQAQANIDPDQSVVDFVSGGQRYWDTGEQRVFVPAYVERFLFDRHSINTPMKALSGGERHRLDLARQLLRGGNFLVLDEPTNDLDLYTLRLLEEAVVDFSGCALIVSHDRYFLNRVCTHMLVFEGAGRVVLIAGNYDDYRRYAAEQRAAAVEASTPAVPAPEPKPGAGKPTKRLTYKEQMELGEMEGRILAAEATVATLEQQLQAPGFYEQEYAVVEEQLQALEAAKQHVHDLYARWEELEARSG